MLGKYWSVFLLAGLIVAALIDARRGQYFRSAGALDHGGRRPRRAQSRISSGWCSINFAPFSYAMGIHGDKPFGGTVYSRARLSRRLASAMSRFP